MRDLHLPTLLLLAAVLLLAGPAAAQIDTGTIDVKVADADGAALPGVTVTARDRDSGAERVAVTNARGLAFLRALDPGIYDVSATLDGFSPSTKADVPLRVGQSVDLRFTLQLAEVSEEITVQSAAPVIDVYRVETSTNIVPEQIEELPVANREFEELAFIAPGVQRERGSFRFIQGGPVIGSGGNASQSTIFVDGVDFTDQALGLSRARFSQDAIREFEVINNQFDAEIGGSAGGALSVVTKSGTNQLSGSLFAFFRDDSLRSTGELEVSDSPYERQQWGGTLGGALAADTTHYFLSVELIDEEDFTPFRPGGAFAGLATDYPNPVEQTLGLLSLDHRLSDSSHLDGKLVYQKYREDNFRVGGVADVSNGQELNRDNWNATLGHLKTWSDSLNELHVQFGVRDYDEPTNSSATEEWFSGGNTLRIGNNVVGDLLGEGDYWEVRDTYHFTAETGDTTHDLKAGISAFHVEERSRIEVFQEGLFLYANDTRLLPILYIFGEGSSDVDVETDIYSAFVQDDWRVRDNLTLSLGLRYDYDDNGNNPDFEHPLVGERSTDDDNLQPRFGFTWDVNGNGENIVRGGAGLFTGRFLLVPLFTELQQNGVTGRIVQSRLNGLILGLPPAFWLDPNNPETTGIPLPPDISLMRDNLEAPEATQLSLGYTRRLGDTGLYASLEGVYVEGEDEIIIRDTNFGGNENPVRPNPAYNQINTYTNEGESEYSAAILSLNGTIGNGHLITASATVSDKKNIADDFSPAFPTGYPSDPADIEAEWGRSRSDEDFRLVLTGVFRLPAGFTVAPIYEYGSGQPWNRIRGYDFNGDGKNSDRLPGVARNSVDGPEFSSFSLRITKAFTLGTGQSIELIAEAFNLFDETNYDVTSVDNAEFLAGPTLANPNAAFVPNPTFGEFRATLPPREIQLGARLRF